MVAALPSLDEELFERKKECITKFKDSHWKKKNDDDNIEFF